MFYRIVQHHGRLNTCLYMECTMSRIIRFLKSTAWLGLFVDRPANAALDRLAHDVAHVSGHDATTIPESSTPSSDVLPLTDDEIAEFLAAYAKLMATPAAPYMANITSMREALEGPPQHARFMMDASTRTMKSGIGEFGNPRR